MTKSKPYVYRVDHKLTGKFYIGYRSANKELPEIDFPKYRTSSKIVKNSFEEFNWCIIATFDTSDDAYDFEQKLIYENWDNPLLINRSCFYNKQRFKRTKGITPWNKGKKMSPEFSEKMSEVRKGKPTTKGMKMPKSAENARKGAAKQAQNATGRKRQYLPDGSWIWNKDGCLGNKEQPKNPHLV